MSLILSAAQFAAQAHKGQKRKYNKDPYIFHPSRVAARTAILPGATDEMVAVRACIRAQTGSSVIPRWRPFLK